MLILSLTIQTNAHFPKIIFDWPVIWFVDLKWTSSHLNGDNNRWCCITALWWRNKTQQEHWPESEGLWEWRADGTLTIRRWSSTGTSDASEDLQVVKHVKEKKTNLTSTHTCEYFTLNPQVGNGIGPIPVIHKASYEANQVEKQTVPMW